MSKILMIGDINPENSNAATLQFLSLAEGFSYYAAKIEIIIPRTRNNKAVVSFKNKNIRVYRKFKSRINLFRLLFRTPWIITHAFGKAFNIIYIQSSPRNFLLTALLKIFSDAHIVILQSEWWGDPDITNKRFTSIRRLLAKLQVLNAKLAHSVHVNTMHFKLLLANHGIDDRKIFIVGNGTATNKIYPLPQQASFKKLNLDPHFVYAGFIGTLHAGHDLECAINAISIVKEIKPYIKLIIVGDGPELQRMQLLAEQLDLHTHVIFWGYVPFKDTNILLNAFDIAIAPFRYQKNHLTGLSPLKIRDYAAASLPTIAADIPGIKDDSIDLPWLTIYKPGDHHALANSILDVVEQTDLRKTMRLAARQYAEKNYDWKNISKQVITEMTYQMAKLDGHPNDAMNSTTHPQA